MKRTQSGFSLMEVMVATAIFGGLAVGMMSYFQDQQKNVNAFEFQGKKEQLRLAIIGQVLNQADNCKCLFNSSTPFPVAGINVLGGPTVTSLGRLNFPTPGNCTGATIPKPLITATGVDGMKLSYANLKNIKLIGGSYLADLDIFVKGTKDMVGTKSKLIRIPVALSTQPATPGNVKLSGCSISSNANPDLPIQWVKTFNSPGIPLTFDVPAGTKKILVTITANLWIGLPGDIGRTPGSQFLYSSDINPTPIQFAEIEVGAGNNNGAQARIAATTTGIIPITTETKITLSRQAVLYNQWGALMCNSGYCGINYLQKTVVLMGLNNN